MVLTFQQIILTLQQYWDKQGCALLQPYDMEVGAGTSHTATFLRALGPEPWKAAYVQPSRRPKDGRYGENPNRLQHYYQYQVVLKPAPSNILELYLGSLEALGFDLKQNDIRFVEDDQAATLGLTVEKSQPVTARGYQQFHEVATLTQAKLLEAGQKPRDLLDVAVFIWRTHAEKPTETV